MSSSDSRSSHSGHNLLRVRIALSVTLVLVGILLTGSASARDLPLLFNVVDTVGVLQVPPVNDRIVVSIAFALIHPEQSPINAVAAAVPGKTINLLKDRIEQRGNENYTWFGKVEDYELSTVVLTVVDGIFSGHINMPGESYTISPNNGNYLVTRDDLSMVPPFGEDAVAKPVRPGVLQVQPLEIAPLADDGSAIDVMVLYTQEMYNTYGPSGNNTLTSKIQSYIDQANAAYNNSNIATNLRLAHSGIYTDATTAEPNPLTSDLLIYFTDDPDVITLRNTYYADLVVLLRHHSGAPVSCGRGWVMTLPGYESDGYSVVEVRDGTEGGYYCSGLTFAHELGHNMGCAHDRANASVQGVYPYSYGYDHVAAGIASPQFATVMSYQSPEIIYFSTPLKTYLGVPIGVTGGPSGNDNPTLSADNARTINNTKLTIANFRDYPATDITPPVDGTLIATPGNGQVSLSWSGFSDSGSGLRSTNTYKVVRNTVANPAAQCTTGTQIYLGTGTSATDTGRTNGQTYYYRVCAYDNSNNISSGATASATLQVRVTVTTSPSGRQITVDGATATAPQTYAWAPGSSHTMNIISPQSGSAGTQYVFSAWSDGGAQSHSINPATDVTYTALFMPQYQLTTSIAPAASGSMSPSCPGACWQNSGTSINMTATPASGYIFGSWSGDCSGMGLTTMVAMNTPRLCTANFAACSSPPVSNATKANPYPSISDAYSDGVNTTDGDTLKILALVLVESLDLNRQLSVVLEGGFDCSFTNNVSTSMVQGAVNVGNGVVTVTHLIASPNVTISGNGLIIMDNLIIQ